MGWTLLQGNQMGGVIGYKVSNSSKATWLLYFVQESSLFNTSVFGQKDIAMMLTTFVVVYAES